MKRLWLISYDVADNHRRSRVARYLLGRGDRVLESLFECHLRADQIPTVRADLLALIDPGEDRLALYPLCAHCQRATRSVGQGRREGCGQPHFHIV